MLVNRKTCHKMCTYSESQSAKLAKLPNLPQVYQLISPQANVLYVQCTTKTVCVHVCMRACVHGCVHACVRAWMCACMRACM